MKKNEINLDTDLLDNPDFLWNNEKYQKNFMTILKYLEVEKRTNILNHRLNIIAVFIDLIKGITLSFERRTKLQACKLFGLDNYYTYCCKCSDFVFLGHFSEGYSRTLVD